MPNMKLFPANFLVFLSLIFASLASAQTTWTGDADGTTFQSPGNWSAGVPTATVGAIIPIDADIALSANASALSLTINESNTVTLTVGATNTLTIAGQVPIAADLGDILIDTGSTFAFSGGNLNLTNGIATVGDGTGIGIMNITGGKFDYDFQTTPDATQVNVGNGGTGTITQSNSSDVVTGNELSIGENGGTGTYNLTDTSILQTGTSQTSGNYFIAIGSNIAAAQTTAGTVGTLNISGSATLSVGATGQLQLGTASEELGTTGIAAGVVGGTGIITQDGAGSNVNLLNGSATFIGTYNGGIGTYNLISGTITMSGGSTMAFGEDAGTTGTLAQSGGTFNAGALTGIFIGIDGAGTYDLSGGTATLLNGFTVGGLTGTAGGSGVVNQTGGVLITGDGVATSGVVVGGAAGTATGIYDLSGGTSTMNGGLTVSANGTVTQSGGTMTITLGQTLKLLQAGGAYNLTSGILQAGNNGTNGLVGTTGEGTLNFRGGTLQVLTGSTAVLTDNLDGTVINTSTLDTTQGGITLGGTLSGTGGFDIIGGNTVTFASPNGDITYTGATTVANGTLVTNASNIAESSAINLPGPGAASTLDLTVNAAGNQLAGTVTGAGVMNVAFNGGALTLASTSNDFTGTINLGSNATAGTLQIFGGTFGAIADDGTGSAVTIGGNSSIATSGTVNFTQNVTYTGLTTVNSGFTLNALGLAGSVTNNGTLFASSLATNVTGAVTNNGTLGSSLSLGSMPTLTIGSATDPSSFTSSATGDMIIRINGPTTDDFLVYGATTLTGSKATVSGYGIVTNQVVLTSDGGLTGAPIAAVTEGNGLLYKATLTDSGDNLLLTTTQSPVAPYAQTPNQRAVANALDPVFTAGNLPANMRNAFNTMTASEIPMALDELSPEVLQYSRDIAFSNATFLAQRVDGVLANVRLGTKGFDTSGVNVISSNFDSGLGRSLNSLLAYDPPGNPFAPAPNGVDYYPDNGGNSPAIAPPPNSPPVSSGSISDSGNPYTPYTAPSPSYNAAAHAPTAPPDANFNGPTMSGFILGDVVLADMNQDLSAANAPPDKAKYTSGDAAAGISFRMTSNLAAGVLFDYTHTSANTDDNNSKTTVDTYSPGIYATWFDKGFYVNGLFSFGYNNYSNTRVIPFLGTTANSSPSGEQYVGNLDCGYDFQPKNHREWIFGPIAGLTYTHLDVDSFNEGGAGPADLSVNSQSLDSLRSNLGGHVIYQARAGSLLFQPNLNVIWQHEFLNNPGITSQFNIPGTSPFSIQTPSMASDSALISTGVTVTLDNSMGFYVNYLADVGADDFFAQSIIGGFKASF